MKKFIFEEKFISYANVEIYAENEEDARLQFQNGNYQYYDISDFTVTLIHELVHVDQNVRGLFDDEQRENEAYQLESKLYEQFMSEVPANV